MDTPKRDVSWLESFPPDLWAYFSCYLPGEQLGRLIMTGAVSLRQRLTSPHVVKSIKLGREFLVFKSWPVFINALPSLEEVCIDSRHLQWSRKLGLTIDLLPSEVRKLELSGAWDPTLFGEPRATLNLSEHLPHLQTLCLSTIDFSDYSWISHSPQSLTRLSLYHWCGTVELPSSLLHFDAETIYLNKDSFVSKLPPSLESFVVTRWLRGVDLILPLLPPSTCILYLGDQLKFLDGVRSPQNLLVKLPKFLSQFSVPKMVEMDLKTNPQWTGLLPSTLTELNIPKRFPCSAWFLLPQGLTKLVCSEPTPIDTADSKLIAKDGLHHGVTSLPFDALPRSITRLELRQRCYCFPPETSSTSYFPPNLTHLQIPNIQLAPKTAKLLPSTLTYLDIANLCERVCEQLPNGLRTLIANPTLVTPNLIKFLPKSLTFLRLFVLHYSKEWLDSNTGEIVDSVFKLPEYSIHESCVSKPFDWKDCSPLPSALLRFYSKHDYELGDSFLRHRFSTSLTELDMGDAKHFTDLSIPLLSPNLTLLRLTSSRAISGKSFKFLPKCLTSLDLTCSESIFDDDIQHLPRTVKLLYFSHASSLTNSCIPDLPPHLEKLSMRFNKKITPSCFHILPYPLRSCQNGLSAVLSEWYIYHGESKQKKKNRT